MNQLVSLKMGAQKYFLQIKYFFLLIIIQCYITEISGSTIFLFFIF